jgi:hypothetical protein
VQSADDYLNRCPTDNCADRAIGSFDDGYQNRLLDHQESRLPTGMIATGNENLFSAATTSSLLTIA